MSFQIVSVSFKSQLTLTVNASQTLHKAVQLKDKTGLGLIIRTRLVSASQQIITLG